jgi:hypothetical protein
MVNRTQALVLGFFLVVLASLVIILAAAPEIYDQALRIPSDSPRWMALTFLAVLAVFIGLLAIGVLRRWRWTFWLILVAFLAGVLRVPVAGLQLTGVLAADGPVLGRQDHDHPTAFRPLRRCAILEPHASDHDWVVAAALMHCCDGLRRRSRGGAVPWVSRWHASVPAC